MATPISKVDAIEIPSSDAERSRTFYIETLGLRPDENTRLEFWIDRTCFEIWEPAQSGGEFEPQTTSIALLHVDDVEATRKELEAKGVEFTGETFDTGVCHMAMFRDPDGNQLTLHKRYAPLPGEDVMDGGAITKVDAIGIPSSDADRSRTFYVETLGLRPDENSRYEFWIDRTCFAIWEPERFGGKYEPQTTAIALLHVDDVEAARKELEARGVEFTGETSDTGVCHMAFFKDPDGNELTLHKRYAPYPDKAAS